MNNKKNKWLENILTLLILTVAFLLISTLIFPEVGIKFFVIESGSMSPTIKTGSLVVTKSSSSYNVDDIITFKRGNQLITHRIITLENGSYQTKGDHNLSEDVELVQNNAVQGKVVLIIPLLGWLVALFLNKIILIGVILSSFVIFIIIKFVKNESYFGNK